MFIDCFRFMSRSLSSLVDNLSEGRHNNKCKDCKSCHKCISLKDNQLIFKCLDCNKNYEKHFNEDLIKRFANSNEFCDGDINKLILLLRKGIYPYEYMNSWKRSNETLLSDKKAHFYGNLNVENIADADYKHAKKVWKSFEIKNLGYYHDLYDQSNTLLLPDVFESF